ncbi:MAG TPA: hypothetical protein VKD72_13645 [Gemmataceae bacterium]|nr:hypothetical protein [Gemmataceae bacterium]
MKSLYVITAGLLAVVLAGCQTGSSTAPGTNPQKPDQVRKLDVKIPVGEQNVTQDATNEVTVSVDRKNFNGPVTIEIRDLPKGVSVVTQDLTIPEGKDSVKVSFKAAADAPVVDNHVVSIVAKAKDMPETQPVTFKFDVKAKGK